MGYRTPQLPTRRKGVTVLLLAAAFAAAVVLYLLVLAANSGDEKPFRERCTATANGGTFSLTPEQASNAATITAVAVARGLPPRAASIALATAVQESGLRNIGYGDTAGPDSRGLFQQRPTQGWGTEEQVMDPVYAANAFYNALEKVPGYQDLPITVAAQTVQRSAYPDAYADHEPEGRAFASALTGQSPAALTCRLNPAAAPGNPETVLSAMSYVYGEQQAVVLGDVLLVAAEGEYGWSLAQWAVANAKALDINEVAYDSRTWNRGTGEWAESDAPATQVAIHVAPVAVG
ncbi:hypothetical protein [Arthrobacter caoxuetaonis]|uniref:Heavy metal transporter n=1 Tax=Arthrobacter caoxuetaonis TaxID=2886935 RepID=A0A9X1SAI5_9MICC|nr:hypothetical protein [Arthrobacter caoxuetaonis]MCC3296680.1 hypothetical protein [Arthrobacter caoxuetaonis]USQ56494.1 hypothetical protein NF551_12160 [Arthrobacter caoxuetaonis]